MKRIAKMRLSTLVLAVVLAFAWLSRAPEQVNAQTAEQAPDLAIIVNRDNPVSSLSMADLRKIYMGTRQYWKANVPISLLIRTPGTREREVMLREIFSMNEAQYKQYWVGKIMRAEATSAPVEVFSSGMTKEGVASLPGAIACLSTIDVRSGVKVLRIDGHLPGETGYPLR